VNCTCPICELSAEYPLEYAGKWHRCKAGCAGTTRLLLGSGGLARTEASVVAEWRAGTLRGRLARGGLAAGLAVVSLTPVLGGGSGPGWVALLAVAGLAASGAAWAAHGASTYESPKPPGL
jgi:hypothetical protein